MRRRFMIALIVLLTGAGVFFAYKYYSEVYLTEKELDEAEKDMDELVDELRPVQEDGQDDETEPNEVGNTADQKNPLEKAQNMNGSVVAWIKVPGTKIDYPVAQAKDNEFYLDHSVNDKYSKIGCPFLDYRCDRDFSGFNSIIYGHHITGRRMFTDISRFKDRTFFNEHSYAWLTLEDGFHKVNFIAYLNVSYDSFVYEVVLITPHDRSEYLEKVWKNAVNTTKDTSFQLPELKEKAEKEELKLLILSTCTYEFNQARGVLVGVIEQ